jgi:hypothetical protein
MRRSVSTDSRLVFATQSSSNGAVCTATAHNPTRAGGTIRLDSQPHSRGFLFPRELLAFSLT